MQAPISLQRFKAFAELFSQIRVFILIKLLQMLIYPHSFSEKFKTFVHFIYSGRKISLGHFSMSQA